MFQQVVELSDSSEDPAHALDGHLIDLETLVREGRELLKSMVDQDQLEILETPPNTDDDAVESREHEVEASGADPDVTPE